MSREDIDRALLAIGLDEAEARLYRLLATNGPSTVGSLAPAAGLSRTKSYTVLDRMVSQGYATLVADQPRTFAAVDPQRLLELRSKDVGSATALLQSELVPLYTSENHSSHQTNLRGTAVLRRAEEMLSKAREDISMVATFVPRELSTRLDAIMKEVSARGVRVRTVISESLAEDGVLGRLKGLVDLRVRSVPNAGVLIVDNEEVLIGSFSEVGDADDLTSGRRRDYAGLHGIWSRDRELIKLQRLFFDRLYGRGAV